MLISPSVMVQEEREDGWRPRLRAGGWGGGGGGGGGSDVAALSSPGCCGIESRLECALSSFLMLE